MKHKTFKKIEQTRQIVIVYPIRVVIFPIKIIISPLSFLMYSLMTDFTDDFEKKSFIRMIKWHFKL